MTDAIERRLRDAFGEDRVQRDAPLAPVTTFKVGGRADWLVHARDRDDISRALVVARELGSARDRSRRRLERPHRRHRSARPRDSRARRATSLASTRAAFAPTAASRSTAWCGGRSVTASRASKRGRARPAPSAAPSMATRTFRGRLISELIDTRDARDARRTTSSMCRRRTMEFGYDYSRLHRTREVVRVGRFPRDRRRARRVARRSRASRWRFASAPSRSSRPAPAASFRIPIRRATRCRTAFRGRPARSSIARVSRTHAQGGARVSTTHANFIVNEGGASADEIRDLVERCKRDVRSRFGVEPARRDCVSRIWFVVRQFEVRRTRTPNATDANPDRASRTPRMATLRIEGGRRLEGSVAVEGNKNAALPLLAACLLTDEECVLTNVPRIRDVEVLVDLLVGLGATVDGRGHLDASHPLRDGDDRPARSRARRPAARLRPPARPAARAQGIGASRAAGRRLSGAADDLDAPAGARGDGRRAARGAGACARGARGG